MFERSSYILHEGISQSRSVHSSNMPPFSYVSNIAITTAFTVHLLCLSTIMACLGTLTNGVGLTDVSQQQQKQNWSFLEAAWVYAIFPRGSVMAVLGLFREVLRFAQMYFGSFQACGAGFYTLLLSLRSGGKLTRLELLKRYSLFHWLGRKTAVVKKFALRRSLFVMAVPSVFLPLAIGAPTDVDLTKFTSGPDGLRVIGAFQSATGASLAQIGDHNGDGFQDFIFGASALRKAIIVIKGNTTYAEVNVANVVSDQYFRVVKGPSGLNFGASVGGIGDINDDGFDDVIAGGNSGTVPNRGSAGYAFVIFGMVGPFTDVVLTDVWVASSVAFMIIAPVNPANMMAINDNARGLGDVNGDGIDDFAVTARSYAGTTAKTAAGVVWIIWGKKTPAFDNIDLLLVPDNFGSIGIYFTGAFAQDAFGHSIRPAGDFNGDGIADFLIGATGFDPPDVNGVARSNAGAVYLMHGSKTTLATMDMSTFVTGTMGVRFLGASSDDLTGRSVSGVGDINGDGIDDIAVGANSGDPPSRTSGGFVYVIYGTTVAFSADVDLFSFTASSLGFAIYGRAQSMQLSTVAPAGDINGDGVNDILVGGITGSSRAHVIFGQAAARTAPVDTAVDDVITFFYMSGATLGIAIDGGKDFNGDGVPDLLLGASTAMVVPAGGGFTLNNAGAVWMVSGLSLFPAPATVPTAAPTSGESAPPSAVPSPAPSNVPSCVPSVEPSLAPSSLPTVRLSLAPSVSPSMNPSAQPTLMPSAAPSMSPSVKPTVTPSLMPSAVPSVSPSLIPSAQPSLMPSADPSENPSVVPSAQPSLMPSAVPSETPSVNPSAQPSLTPTVVPSVASTVSPTATPTMLPTVSPSAVPSARPTVPAVKDYEVVVDVEQVVSFVTKADYDAQQAAYNKTIQHTISDTTEGVTPERVTDIVVEEDEEGERNEWRSGVRFIALAVNSVLLKYKVTAKDPAITIDSLRAQLVQAAQEGKMDAKLRIYAAQFGATGLNNGTFALPQVTSAAVQRDASSQLTGVQIALLVIGVVVGLVLLASIVWIAQFKNTTQSAPPATALPETNQNNQLNLIILVK